MEIIFTIYYAWVYLTDCNNRDLFIIKREKTWFKQSEESFSKAFMIFADFTYNGK